MAKCNYIGFRHRSVVNIATHKMILYRKSSLNPSSHLRIDKGSPGAALYFVILIYNSGYCHA